MGEEMETAAALIDGVWHAPPRRLSLSGAEVHVWLIDLAQPNHAVAELECLLAQDERERAAQFHFERDRLRFKVAKAATRQILARYLDAEPRSLRFAEGAFGKPHLDSGDVRFNLSHSGGYALLAAACGREVGVDLEEVRELKDFASIAERFFSPGESGKLRSVTDAAGRAAAFFNCWTRKEAFIKAIGEGLSHPLDTFEVAFLPNETVELRGDASTRRWVLKTLPVPKGYSGALVMERLTPEGAAPTISRWRWGQTYLTRLEAD
jgi:4'-phosphopantetheinyl transferase